MFKGDTLLRLYKEQYGIEQNFGFLKDPAFINGIFLKKPEWIEVLGMIMILALMIWRLMEREMRRYIAKSLNEVQLAFLKALGAKPEDFLPT